MIVTALSQMSRLSNAFRFIDYEVDISRQDTVQNMTAIMLNNNQMQLQKPALYVSGALSFVDQNVINNHFEAGTSAARLETGYSSNRNATIIGLDLHLADFKTRTMIPGLDSANEVVVGNATQGLDLAGKIGSYGVQFNVGRDYTQGTGAAVRTLVDLAMIELIGKWSRLPYWRCLTLDQSHPEFQRQMRDWYDDGSPAVHSKLVRTALVSQGYMSALQNAAADNSADFKAAVGRFQSDTGMVVTGLIDFATYERVLRSYTALDPEGKLITVGWSPTNAQPVAIVTSGETTAKAEGSTSEQMVNSYGGATAPREIDLQIKNVQLDKHAFEVGDQIFLSASVSRASHMYCYLQEATGNVLRLLPNASNTESLVSANLAVRIPDWMSTKPGFILDAAAPGHEFVMCLATEDDVLPKLPAPLQANAFKPIEGYKTTADITAAFAQAAGAGGFSQATVTWLVSPKSVKAAQK
jgi:hypothetical protein